MTRMRIRKTGNRLLDGLSQRDRRILTPKLKRFEAERGTVLFEPGTNVDHVCFPGPGTVALLVLQMRDGKSAEAAMIGTEGALGGVISHGSKPAYARGIVEVPGTVYRLPTATLDVARLKSSSLRDHFARYADCLLAQALQSVACNALHGFDARLARWLLTAQDRVGSRELSVTQDFVARMLGVRRTYATRIVGALEQSGAIQRQRGIIAILDRRKLERRACECYVYLRRHFERMLPGIYPAYSRSR